MKVLVCGSRHFNDYELLRKILNDMFVIIDEQPFPHLPEGFVLIQGGAKGTDDLADQWAATYGIASNQYNADWEKYGNAAGPIRNKQMLDEGKPDLVVAFLAAGSRGTRNMISQAKKSKIPVQIILIDPKPSLMELNTLEQGWE